MNVSIIKNLKFKIEISKLIMSTEIVAKKTSKTGSIAGNWEEISRNYAIPIFLGLLSREAIKASILLLQDIFTIDMTDVDYNIVVL